ncbi:uncharacterized protein LOC113291435 [Papaver somniferum]|uniref:uncharacterized protein LOC113291435 n=1 Tax=Papaver somniferum TaxID=3469 RepID=UPI000E703F59|nr:uncharacterized protein LOC113291435 [Papaver somniferum]
MHGDQADLWVQNSIQPQGRGIWKGIQKQKYIIEANTDAEIEDGKSIKFWWDKWKIEMPLKERFPRIYKIALHKNATLRDMVTNGSWNCQMKRNLNNEELIEITELLHLLAEPPVFTKEEDSIQWRGTYRFSTKNCYNWLIEIADTPSSQVP